MISVRQMKAERALLAWSQSDLAAASGISEPTIGRLEAEDGPVGVRAETGAALVAALEKAGVEFNSREWRRRGGTDEKTNRHAVTRCLSAASSNSQDSPSVRASG